MEDRTFREMLLHPDTFAPMQIETVMDAIDKEPDVACAWESFAANHPLHRKVPAGVRRTKVVKGTWLRKVATAAIAIVACGVVYTVAVAEGFLPNLFAPSEKVSEDDEHQVGRAETVVDTNTVTLPNETESILYDNVPLSQILDDVAAYHNQKIIYLNEQTGKTRLFYKWQKIATLEETIQSLNGFERISIAQKDSTIIVQ